MAEYIGSRISLISKRDIRYVGTLHEISSENSTVALEQVKSYGTEGRDPENEIPPSDNVYEYIVFRGSDVKDLRIEKEPEKKPMQQPQVPDDPAILGNARPTGTPSSAVPPAQAPQAPQAQRQPPPGPPQPSAQFQNHQHFPSQQQQSQSLGRFNQQPNYPPYQYPIPPNQRYGPPGSQGFPPYSYPMPYGSPPPGWFPPPGQGFPHPPPGQFFPPPGPFGPPGQPPMQQGPPSKPATPAEHISNKEGASAAPQSVEKPATTVKLPTPPIPAALPKDGPPPPTESKPDVTAALAPPAPTIAKDVPAAAKQTIGAPKSGRIMPAIPILSPAVKPKAPVNGAAPTNASNAPVAAPDTQKLAAPRQTLAPTKSLEDANRDARAAVAAAMAKLPPAPGQAPKKQTNGEISAIDNLTNKVNEMRTNDNIRQSRQPGTGGYAAGHRGGRGGHRGGRQRDDQQGKKIELPKDDYDFASANAKFNKQDLVKEAIASASPIGSPADGPSAEDSVNGTRQSEVSVSIAASAGYSKASSFFDNISSEMKDRNDKKLGGREFRNEERNKNLETFGQGSVDNGYRGGFRGRGRGRGLRGGRGSGYGGERRGRGSIRGRGAATAED